MVSRLVDLAMVIFVLSFSITFALACIGGVAALVYVAIS